MKLAHNLKSVSFVMSSFSSLFTHVLSYYQCISLVLLTPSSQSEHLDRLSSYKIDI